MYEMYPDWGPARHRHEHDQHDDGSWRTAQASVQAGLDLRDNGGQRPDDN